MKNLTQCTNKDILWLEFQALSEIFTHMNQNLADLEKMS